MTANDLRLYHAAASPNSRRVRMFIAEKGIPVPLVAVDLAKGEQHGEAYRAINPVGLHAWGTPLSLTIVFTTLMAILFTTPLAWLTWLFIETPAIGLGRSLGRQKPTLQVAR